MTHVPPTMPQCNAYYWNWKRCTKIKNKKTTHLHFCRMLNDSALRPCLKKKKSCFEWNRNISVVFQPFMHSTTVIIFSETKFVSIQVSERTVLKTQCEITHTKNCNSFQLIRTSDMKHIQYSMYRLHGDTFHTFY